MHTSEIKLELFRYIDDLPDSDLKKIYNIFIKERKTKSDFWLELNDFQKQDIELGLDDLRKGNKYSFDEVLQELK